jgi:hypothetical protein
MKFINGLNTPVLKFAVGGVLSFGLFVAVISLLPGRTLALSASNFNAGRIIDVGVFTNANSMSVDQIQSFLNAEVPTCDTSGSQSFTAPNGQVMTHAQWGAEYDSANSTNIGAAPYVCLENYIENPSTGQNNLQNPSASIPGGESAAWIIYNAAQANNINPQVLLTTLQKEQGLITDNWPWTNEYTEAMGFNCPDSGGCSGFAGFYQQVTAAAAQYRNYLNNPNDFNYVVGNNSIAYAPGCSGSTVNIQNQATAALYDYTPYQPNSNVLANTNPTGSSSGPGGAVSGSCNAYGNRNFWWYFNTWFGTTLANGNAYSFVTSSASSLNYNPGQTGSVTIVLENTGSSTWYSDTGLPAGEPVTRLATVGYQNSPFITPDANSLNTQNQVLMTPATVAPGQQATFTFEVRGPYQTLVDNIYLVPIVGGQFLSNDNIDVVLHANAPSWQLQSSSIGTQTPSPNQQTAATFTILNTSGSTWYSDTSLPAGDQPTRLATIGYQNSPFADIYDPSWLGTRNQIIMTPDTVAPGQVATFSAYFIGPIGASSQTSAFHFDIEVGGVFGIDNGCMFYLSTPASNLGYRFVTSTASPSINSMAPGATSTVTVTLQNTGNVVWQDENYDGGDHAMRLMMNRPNYRSSAFYDSSDPEWLTHSLIAMPTGTVWPGQSTTFSFTWLAPTQAGYYNENFAPTVGGNFMQDDGLAFQTTVL